MSDQKSQTKTPQARTPLSRKLSPSGGLGIKKLQQTGAAN
jgi:hypothetical protein